MKFKLLLSLFIAATIFSLLSMVNPVCADDLDDGISKATDESISADDEALKTDTNVNFIVLESMSQAQKRKKQGDKNANFNDGSGDQNENSVVVGPGTQTGNIYNVIIEK